jgi:predicted transcriptional regulator
MMNQTVREAIDREFAKVRRMLKHPESREEVRAVIALPPWLIDRILTKRRNELLEILQRRRVNSVSQLAQLTGRNVKSVSHDLKILSSFGFVRYERRFKPAVANYVVMKIGKSQRAMTKVQPQLSGRTSRSYVSLYKHNPAPRIAYKKKAAKVR